MVPEVQTSSRRHGCALNSPFRNAKKSGCAQLPPSASVCSRRYTYQRATAVVRRQNRINHPRRTAVVVDSQVIARRCLIPLGSLEHLFPDLHSIRC